LNKNLFELENSKSNILDKYIANENKIINLENNNSEIKNDKKELENKIIELENVIEKCNIKIYEIKNAYNLLEKDKNEILDNMNKKIAD